MKDGRKRDAEGKIPRITKTCSVTLVGPDIRMKVGDFTLTEMEPGPTIEQFADEAFKSARASLARLMTPLYSLVVSDGKTEQGFGLERWIKLVDSQKEQEERVRKQRLRKHGLAA